MWTNNCWNFSDFIHFGKFQRTSMASNNFTLNTFNVSVTWLGLKSKTYKVYKCVGPSLDIILMYSLTWNLFTHMIYKRNTSAMIPRTVQHKYLVKQSFLKGIFNGSNDDISNCNRQHSRNRQSIFSFCVFFLAWSLKNVVTMLK